MNTEIVSASSKAYVRQEPAAVLPPPGSLVGPLAWMRDNLFSSPGNILLTVVAAAVAYISIPGFLNFLIFDAVWTGADREACIAKNGVVPGACWAFVRERVNFFIYGFYPVDQRWRVDVFFVLGAIGVAWMLWLKAPRRDIGMIYFLVVLPLISYFLLGGADWLGLSAVDTARWGGLMVTLVVAGVGIVASLPLGILLALGRRSKLPVIKFFSVMFIEFVRGVPLITVLFMANTMLPLFLPDNITVDKLLRALVGIGLFASAYMAEVVRAGLQALPKGQYEGAMAMGLGYWQMMRLIILPQALKVTIPNIVNTYIGLFKDTSLLLIVGIFDFLKAIETARIDPQWAAPTTSTTGYAFAAIVYFLFCYGMASYARAMERRLSVADKR
ncbi:amino acid ABC transporter permease [Rhabdaerophilum sp. SD176]|uniref:amino acid ABC transporter permease n=1 Tax=Rhabdaerophilum sp. SD176 TaxID=2983548 RepID=UPI0024DFF859|nr:amino acid ABC transporter permease [Rhabdaerophilum sp. SD176]